MKATLVYRGEYGTVTKTFAQQEVEERRTHPTLNVPVVRRYIKGANHQLEDAIKEARAKGFIIIRAERAGVGS